jgi:hypothetical protein
VELPAGASQACERLEIKVQAELNQQLEGQPQDSVATGD